MTSTEKRRIRRSYVRKSTKSPVIPLPPGVKRRDFTCNQCTSAFGSKMELEEHVNSHTGEKPFPCNICGARFSRRSSLWNHKRIHSNKKPFQCPVCRLEFKWKNSLKCHGDVHLRNKDVGSEKFDMEALKNLSFTGGRRQRRRKMKPEDELIKNYLLPRPIEQKIPPIKYSLENVLDDIETADPNEFKDLIVFYDDISSTEQLITVEVGTEQAEIFTEISEQDFNESLFLTRTMTPVGPWFCLTLPKICAPYADE